MRLVSFIGVCFFVFGLVSGVMRMRDTAKTNLLGRYNQYIREIAPMIRQQSYSEAGRYIVSNISDNRRLLMAVSSYLGGEVYRQEGARGISTCFSIAYEASFACEHGFLFQMLTESTHAFDAPYQACLNIADENEKSSCIHMLGHALAARTDYSPAAIAGVIQECKKYPYAGQDGTQRYSCESGVTMEYYLARLGKSGLGLNGNIQKDTRLAYDPKHPYDMCPHLDRKEECYNHVVNWWLLDVKLPRVDVGALCLSIAEESSRESCLTMLGRYEAGDMLGELNDQVNKKSNLMECKQMADASLRQQCYADRLIEPQWSVFVHESDDRCRKLSLGTYESLCQQVIQESISSYDFF